MKHVSLFCTMLLAVSSLGAAAPDIPELRTFRAPAAMPREHVPGFLWLEAEAFENYGEWKIDTQFTHKMGSAYLIAPGVGKPIADATTTIQIPSAGSWHVWVRTKDWLPEYSPGRFQLVVGVHASGVLGASGKDGWRWEQAGVFELPQGAVTVALKDLSGAYARCDAILFTQDAAYVPPVEAMEVSAARLKYTGADGVPADGGEYDVVVVGAGPAGMGASLAAARTGAKVALVHDRPVLGGNSSSELGIGTDGAAGSHPNAKMNARETGLCEEANLLRARTAERTLSSAYKLMTEAEHSLSVFRNQRALSVEKKGDTITAVIARDTLTGKTVRYGARIVIDCTGDGWIGRFADADYMYGREARSEYNEAPAPEVRDNLTMSGCLMGGCIAYRYRRNDQPTPYTTPAWANVLPEGFTRRVSSIAPAWWIEHGGRFDDCADPERARDELIRISFAYWGWLKNDWSGKAEASDAELTWVPFTNARREGFRLTGDYVLTANDALEGRMFPDRISYGGWPLDTHDPLGMENPNGNGYWKSHPGVPVYSIPYRVLYSRNITNLMFAGRCQSVTHIALGSVRVEATLFTLGQAAGTAAALAVQKNLSPRDYGKRHIRELQQRLLKDDQYIPELRNEDPDDMARTASVTATSVMDAISYDREEPGLYSPQQNQRTRHELNMPRAVCFARGLLDRLEAVECVLISTLDKPVEMTAKIYETDDPKASPNGALFMGEVTGTVPANGRHFVRFTPATPWTLGKSHVWIVLPPTKGVFWTLRDRPLGGTDCRAYGNWTVVDGQQYSFVSYPHLTRAIDSKPEYVIDGVSRPVDDCFHGWISKPSEKLPQSLTLTFPKTITVSEIRLTFDTNLTPTRVYLSPMPSQLVKSYLVEGYDGEAWTPLVEEGENTLRHRVHKIAARQIQMLRATVREAWGDASARIFEIRVY